MSTDFLFQAVIFLSAAVLLVPFAKKLGLSSILGYLFAGIIIGPFVLGFVGEEGEDILHIAEFGVVMMLFLIGLELDPYKFWKMRKFIVGMGLLQMLGTVALVVAGLYFLLGWSWQSALAVALALALSSTAIVLQTLKEKGLSQSSMGRSSFAVLLFQDIAVIPILAILPLLATGQATANEAIHSSLIADFPGWLQTLVVVGAIAAVYFGGKYLIVPLLRMVARTRLQELFTASALLLIVAVSYLMQLVGLSPALGAFLAGVVLANSEFRHELEGDIAPFKGLLLGLFFIAVGASINFGLIVENPLFILLFVLLLTAAKLLVLLVVGRVYKLHQDQNVLFSLGLSQAGEFGFVIMGFSAELDILPKEIANQIMAIIAISMLLTPFLLLLNEKLIDPYFGVKEKADEQSPDEIDEQNEVIIAGFGHFGSTIGRLLRANGVKATILDNDSDRVESLRKMGFKVYYGDATRLEMLKAAGAENAKLFIAAIDNPVSNLTVIDKVTKHFPNLTILTRARNRIDAYEFIDKGINNVYRETLYSAVHLGVDALVHLGHRKYSATRQGQQFIKYDEETLRRLVAKRHDRQAYLVTVREEIEMQEELLRSERFSKIGDNDHAWDNTALKEEMSAQQTN